MIYECTDCEYCISYTDAFRLACGHPALRPDAVLKYQPLYDKDAGNCLGFTEGEPFELTWAALMEAEELYINASNAEWVVPSAYEKTLLDYAKSRGFIPPIKGHK